MVYNANWDFYQRKKDAAEKKYWDYVKFARENGEKIITKDEFLKKLSESIWSNIKKEFFLD
tara:strand:- start:294 stop:476 length:183 start_codon:yes stop_codon:yes gene_type:complete